MYVLLGVKVNVEVDIDVDVDANVDIDVDSNIDVDVNVEPWMSTVTSASMPKSISTFMLLSWGPCPQDSATCRCWPDECPPKGIRH